MRQTRNALLPSVMCALCAVGLPLLASPGWITFGSLRAEAPGMYAIDMETGALLLLFPGFSAGRWSADGSKVATVHREDRNGDIYVMDADGRRRRNVTQHPALDQQPAWSPDGSRIAFVSNREDGHAEDVFVMNADGTDVRNLTRTPRPDTRPHWAPDGKRIVFHSTRDSTDWVGIPRSAIRDEIYTMNADGSDPRRLTDNTMTANPSGRRTVRGSSLRGISVIRPGASTPSLLMGPGAKRCDISTSIPAQRPLGRPMAHRSCSNDVLRTPLANSPTRTST